MSRKKFWSKPGKKAPSGRTAPISVPSLLETKLFVELINAAAGIHELLLASIEGVTIRADLNPYILFRTTSLIDGATGTADGGGLVIRMYPGLHDVHLS